VPELFDIKLRAMRRDRAQRIGPELFLHERAFADCLERLELIQRTFGRALLIGCPDPAWRERLQRHATEVEVADPGHAFALAAGGGRIVEDEWAAEGSAFDLIMAIGTLDTVNDLPRALLAFRHAQRADALLIGAISGGDTLRQLRGAMRAADEVPGDASPHVHPRIEASALAGLLESAGFHMPVVDVDRVQVAYRSLEQLVDDLRRMGATNILAARSRQPMSRRARQAARQSFAAAGDGERTIEVFELLHFAAWTPARADQPNHG